MMKYSRLIFIVCGFLFIFLPWWESGQKEIGFFLLLAGAILVGLGINRKKIRFDLPETLFLLFLISASVSTILSSHRSNSFLELLKYVALFLFFISIRRLDQKSNRWLHNIFIGSIIINSIIFSLFSIINFLPLPFKFMPKSVYNFYYPTFGHNDLAALLLFSMPITFFLILAVRKNSAKKRLLSIILLLFLVGFLFSFSKSAYLTLIAVFFLIYYFLEKKNLLLSQSARIIHLVVISAALVYLVILVNSYFLKYRERPLYSQIVKPLYRDWRWKYINVSLVSLSERPLFGIGLDNFRFAASDLLEKPSNWSDHGENYYITILSETGLVGGISILSLMAVLVYKILRRLFTEKNLVSIGISFAVLASSIHVVAAPDWYYLTIFLFFWLGTALILPVETPS